MSTLLSTVMVRPRYLNFLLLAFLATSPLWSQTQWPATDFEANETLTLSPAPTPIRITLPLVDSTNVPIVTYDIKTYPTKGSLSSLLYDGISSHYVEYTPALYENGEDFFEWNSTIVSTTVYKIIINVAQINNEPEIQGLTSNSLFASFPENQNIVGEITVFDPDNAPTGASNFTRTPLGLLNLNIAGTNSAYFTPTFSALKSTVPDYYVWDITFASQSLNYESWSSWRANNNGGNWFKIDLNASDVDLLSNPLSDDTVSNLEIQMSDVNEAPEIQQGAGPVSVTIDEDNSPTAWPTGGISLTAVDVDSSGSLKWKFQSNLATPLGNVVITNTTSTASETLTPNTWSTMNFTSSTTIKVDYSGKTDLFGSETLIFTVSDRHPSNPLEDSYTVNVTIAENLNDDVPSLNEASPITLPILENTSTTIYDFNSTDTDLPGTIDHASLSYYVTGTDSSFFAISTSGELSFIVSPDYETPQDDNLDNTYILTVGVNDNNVNTINNEQSVSVVVQAAAEAPRLTTVLASPYAITLNEDSNWTWASDLILYRDLNATDDDTGQSIAWAIDSSPSKGVVDLTGSGEQPSIFTYTADGNATGADTFTIKVFDTTSPTPLKYSHVFNITINPLPDDPKITRVRNTIDDLAVSAESNATIRVDENSSGIIYISASDADASDTLTYLIEGPDAALFDINPTSGQLSFKVGSEPDFESPSDANNNGLYEIIVKVEDDASPKGFDALTLYVEARDQNEAPNGITPTTVTIAENTTFVSDLNASDIDYEDNNSNLVWTLDTALGADTSKFSITPDGLLSFNNAPNFEFPDDADSNNNYIVGVKVTDTRGSFSSTTLNILVENANDAPTVTLANLEIPVAEGIQDITTFIASDEDDPANAVEWRISDGNLSLFSLNSASGVLRFVSTSVMPDLDFNATGQGEASVDNKTFILSITARDSNNTEETKIVTVKVEQANDIPFTDPAAFTNGVIVQTINEDGNLTLALSSIITDPEGEPMGFAITDAPGNASQITLGAASGTLFYKPNPDWSGSDDLNVTVMDSAGNIVVLPIAIDVTPVNDTPTIPNYISAKQVDEGHQTEIYDFNATDIDSDDNALTFGVVGTDSSRFNVNQTSGSLTFASTPDYENPGDASGDNIYDLNITVTDLEGAVLSLPLSILIRNVNEPPTLSGDTLGIDVSEEETYSVDLNTYFGTQGGSLTFAEIISEQNGTASVSASTGIFTYISNQDFSGSDYLEINATDSGVSTTLKILITVFPVNDPPIITNKATFSSSTRQINENVSEVLDLNVTDPSDIPASVNFSWTLGPKDANASHSDYNYFNINVSTGELAFKASPDFESDSSILGTNIYELVVFVSDNQGGIETDSIPLRIEVMPVDETPSFSKPVEVLTTFEDTNVDGNLSSYFSDPDIGTSPQFILNSNPSSGTLQSFNASVGSFTYLPNANSTGLDSFEVNATDGFNPHITIRVDIDVIAVNDPPAITVNYTTPIQVIENIQYVWDLNVSDLADNNAATSYVWNLTPLDGNTSHTDYVYFTIDGATGALSFIAPPDFDTDNSVSQNNIYDFSVSVSDLGGNANDGNETHIVNLKVRVTDGDETPILYNDQQRSSTTSSLTVSYTTNEDTSFTDSNFSLYAIDPEGQNLTWAIALRSSTLGTPTIGAANGVLSYSPLAHSYANDVFDVNVSDPSGNVAQITVDVVINPIGDNPFFAWPSGKTVNDFYTILVDEGATEVLDFNASDEYDFNGDYNATTANYFWYIRNLDGNLSHTDKNYFKINAASGLVAFRSPADMEDNGSINPGYYEFDV